MSSGYTHTQITLYTSVIVTSVTFLITEEPISFIFGLGILTGVLLTPDLDVDSGNYSIHVIRQIFGELGALIWQIYWWPYSKLFSHRGISHWFMIGTFSRVTYSFLINPTILIIFYPQFWKYYIIWLIGLMLADAIHIITDRITSNVKRRIKKYEQR